MRFRILGSGSKGNSCLVQTGRALFLIDNGFSGKELLRRLAAIDVRPEDINGVIVSHEHTDHVKGVGVFARKFHTPVYLNKETYLPARKKLQHTEVRFFQTGDHIEYRDLVVETFTLSHDAGDPVGFVFSRKPENGEPFGKLGYVTDLGEVSSLVESRLADVASLVLESNHDKHMLLNGPYPWHLKQRIQGRKGHLSNDAAAELISRVVRRNGLGAVTLAHLSEKNNDPGLARETVLARVEQECGRHIRVHVASQNEPMDEIVLSKEEAV